MDEESRIRLRGALECVAAGDILALADVLDPDVVWHGLGELVPGGAPQRGLDAVVDNVLRVFSEAYEQFEIATESYLEVDECLISFGTFIVRPQGATRSVRTPFIQVAEFRAGRVVDMRWLTDTAEWLFAMPEVR